MIVMMQLFALALSCVFAIGSGPVIAGQSTVAKGDRVGSPQLIQDPGPECNMLPEDVTLSTSLTEPR